jgi:hypothetical protein
MSFSRVFFEASIEMGRPVRDLIFFFGGGGQAEEKMSEKPPPTAWEALI